MAPTALPMKSKLVDGSLPSVLDDEADAKQKLAAT
jgi:hypothetical protein